jgi:gluconolactonase
MEADGRVGNRLTAPGPRCEAPPEHEKLGLRVEIKRLVDGLDHPEGIAWDSKGALIAGGEAGQIYRVPFAGDEAGPVEEIGNTGGFCLGIAVDGDGGIYVCDHVTHAVFRVADGKTSVYSSGDGSRSMRTPNFPVFDAAGRLYVSDSGTWGQDDGCLWRVEPGGSTSLAWDGGGRFTNGLALAPAGDFLYVAESSWPGIVRHSVEADGALGPREDYLAMPEAIPDGLAFTASGALLVSCYRPDAIYVIESSDEGPRLDVLVSDWTGLELSAPTNIAFCGDGLDRLVAANLAGSQLAEVRAGLVGAPLHRPAGIPG